MTAKHAIKDEPMLIVEETFDDSYEKMDHEKQAGVILVGQGK